MSLNLGKVNAEVLKEHILRHLPISPKVEEIVGALDQPPTVVPKEKSKLYSPKEMPLCGVLFIRTSIH